jgi:hypothetical protein
MMTYAEIEARIVADLNRSDLTSSVQGWVNDVYNEILSRRPWKWLTATTEASTVVDEYRYELPNDYGEVLSLVIVDGTNAQSIPYITVEEFDKRFPTVETDTSSVPFIFTVRHGITPAGVHYDEINTYPRADSTSYVMRLYYSIRAAELSGSVTPLIPSSFQGVLVFGGLELGFARLREYDAAAYWMKKKEILYAAMEADDKKFPSQAQMKPFSPADTTLPSAYWLNYTVRSI